MYNQDQDIKSLSYKVFCDLMLFSNKNLGLKNSTQVHTKQ